MFKIELMTNQYHKDQIHVHNIQNAFYSKWYYIDSLSKS